MKNNKIVATLKVMCDVNNPQDKKLLLLAELVETNCDNLAERQNKLNENIEATNKKLDKLVDMLEKIEKGETSCPVYQNKAKFENMTMFLKNPKMSLLIIVGLVALLLGFVGSSIMDVVKFLI